MKKECDLLQVETSPLTGCLSSEKHSARPFRLFLCYSSLLPSLPLAL